MGLPDKNRKIPGNVPGRYYVDTNCIDCALCPEIAPGSFQSNFEEGFVVVFRQPVTPAEEKLCREALDICPVSAIGDDGIEPVQDQPVSKDNDPK